MENKNTEVAKTSQNTALAIPSKEMEVAKKLDEVVQWAHQNVQLAGFEKTYSLAHTIGLLTDTLTTEYMKPILRLQGSKLGFKTDKDTSGGYDEATVKRCLIEATLSGLQVIGNQFNIIGGNCYSTKEGLGYLLNNFPGLAYEIIPALPRINAEKTSAAIDMKIVWAINDGAKKERTLAIPVKMNQYMGTDAVIGKAMRKARAWLYATISGRELPEGDATDTDNVKDKTVSKPLSAIGEDTKFEDIPKTKEEPDGAAIAPGPAPKEPAPVTTDEPAKEKTKTKTVSISGTDGLFGDKK